MINNIPFGSVTYDTWHVSLYVIVFVVSFGVIILLSFWEKWALFAGKRKWGSRVILCLSFLFLSFSLTSIFGMWAPLVPAKLSFDNPNLTASAIKMGIAGIILPRELTSHLPPENEKLVNCIVVLSGADMRSRQAKCGDDRACFEKMLVLSRAEIIEKIRQSQTTNIEYVSEKCKDVDVSKL